MSNAVHPHTLRLGLDLARWLPVAQEPEPSDSSPARGWQRFDLTAKAVLEKLINRVDTKACTEAWAVPAPQDDNERHFLTLRALGEMVDRSARQVRRILKRLEGLGLVEREYRDWGASRFHLGVEQLAQLVSWNRELGAKVESWRRQTWRGERPEASAEELPQAAPGPRPPPLLSSPNRAERRAQVLGPGPDWTPRPKPGTRSGALDRPALVPWALSQAQVCLSRYGLPGWAQRGAQGEGQQQLALLCLGYVALEHGDAERSYMVQLGGVYARRLAVLWRGAGCPDAALLLELLAQVNWARQVGLFDQVRTGPQGRWLRRPELKALHRPAAWADAVLRAREAYRAAPAAAPDLEPAELVAQVLAELGRAGADLDRAVRLRSEAIELAEQLEARGDVDQAEQLRAEVLASQEPGWTFAPIPPAGPAPPD